MLNPLKKWIVTLYYQMIIKSMHCMSVNIILPNSG